MPWSGSGRGSGDPGAPRPRSTRCAACAHGLPVIERERTCRGCWRPGTTPSAPSGFGLLHRQPDRAGPDAGCAERHGGRHLAARADAARGQHRRRRHGVDHLRPEHQAADLAGVAAALVALGDDDVDAGLLVAQRLVGAAAERRHQAARVVDLLDHLRRRRAERVGEQLHLLVLERHLDLRRRRWRASSRAARGALPLRAARGRRGRPAAWRRSRGAPAGTAASSCASSFSASISPMPSYLLGITVSTP